jgi:PAS domain S-box-containing protein
MKDRTNMNQNEIVFKEMMEAVPVAAFALDAAWKITYMNPGAEKLTGVASSEAIGMRSQEIFASLGKKGDKTTVALQKGESIKVDSFMFDSVDGEKVVCEFRCTPIQAEGGKVTGYMGFLTPPAADGKLADQ